MANEDRSSVLKLNVVNLMDKNIGQLKAMLAAIYGGGAAAFHEMAEEQKDRYLWACHDKVDEIEQLWNKHQARTNA